MAYGRENYQWDLGIERVDKNFKILILLPATLVFQRYGFSTPNHFQAAIQYFKEASIERKLLQMAKVYMDEADFDDSDTWFHDGQDDEPKEQEVELEVSVTIRLCKKWTTMKSNYPYIYWLSANRFMSSL